MLKLAILAGLGYAGYRYFRQNLHGHAKDPARGNAVAGGPLSDDAELRHKRASTTARA